MPEVGRDAQPQLEVTRTSRLLSQQPTEASQRFQGPGQPLRTACRFTPSPAKRKKYELVFRLRQHESYLRYSRGSGHAG